MEALESQMRELSSMMSDTEAKKSEKESELKAALDKISVLREIITALEQQLQGKVEREEALEVQIGQLENIITAQTKNQQELVQELDAIKSGGESRHLNERIDYLEVSQLCTLYYNTEQLKYQLLKCHIKIPIISDNFPCVLGGIA